MSKAKRPRKRMPDEQPRPKSGETIKPRTPPDVTSPRAKSSAHKKVTADKWNQ